MFQALLMCTCVFAGGACGGQVCLRWIYIHVYLFPFLVVFAGCAWHHSKAISTKYPQLSDHDTMDQWQPDRPAALAICQSRDPMLPTGCPDAEGTGFEPQEPGIQLLPPPGVPHGLSSCHRDGVQFNNLLAQHVCSWHRMWADGD